MFFIGCVRNGTAVLFHTFYGFIRVTECVVGSGYAVLGSCGGARGFEYTDVSVCYIAEVFGEKSSLD